MEANNHSMIAGFRRLWRQRIYDALAPRPWVGPSLPISILRSSGKKEGILSKDKIPSFLGSVPRCGTPPEFISSADGRNEFALRKFSAAFGGCEFTAHSRRPAVRGPFLPILFLRSRGKKEGILSQDKIPSFLVTCRDAALRPI